MLTAVVTALIASVLITVSPASAAQPTVGGGNGTGTFAHTENGPALAIGGNITIANGLSYAGQFVDFAVGSSAATEFLSLLTDGAPVTTLDVVSVVGTSVYLGNGTTADVIGSIDPVRNGASGNALRVNFTSAFANPSFEDNTNGWTIFDNQIDLGVTAFAGCTTVDTNTYPGSTPNQDNNIPQFPGSLTTQSVTGDATAGTHALQLLSQSMTTFAGFDVVHGPAVMSSAFQASAGDTIYFDWRAFGGDDAYDVFGYIINVAAGCIQTVVLDATGLNASTPTNWATKATVIPTSGTYRFVFVSGTFDATGLRGAGASLFIDNVLVFGNKATDAVVQQVARKLTYRYENNPDFYVPATRIVTVTAQSADPLSHSTTIAVDVTPLPEAPFYLDDTLAAMHRGIAYTDGVTTRAYLPAVYAVSIGSLPPGLTLNTSTGAVTGTPTTSGSFPFTIIAANTTGSASRSFAGVVLAPPVTFTDNSLGRMLVGATFTDGVLADGVAPPTYALTAGTLPPGLALNTTTGAITGTPTGLGGAYSFTITATNADGSLPLALSGTVFAAPTAFTDVTLARIGTTTPYSDAVVANGVLPPTYAVTSGTMPAGLTLNANGTISGTATTGGTYSFTITATNADGNVTWAFSGTVFSPPVFTDSTIGHMDTTTVLDDGVTASGVEPPVFSISAGTLPDGLTLNTSTGAITGTPTTGGAYSFTITATNSEGVASVALSGLVFTGPSAFTDSVLGRMLVGAQFTDGVAADGVEAPTYTLTAGALPAGLALNPTTGAITGIPTTGGEYSFEITATNSEGAFARTFSVTVFAAPTVFTDATLARIGTDVSYDDGVNADGVLAPTYTLTAGTLPVGLALNATTGAITGTATTGGPYSFSITATNNDGSVTQAFSGTVFAKPVFTDSLLGRMRINVALVDGVAAAGVETPTYALTAGTLPVGLTLNTTTGAVTGTPTVSGAFSFTITATNSEGTAVVSFSDFVYQSPFAFTDGTVGRMLVGTVFDDAIVANGVEPPTYSVTAGTLPAGLLLNATTGAITGTPTGLGGAYSFTITATNSAGFIATTLTGTVFAAPVFTESLLGRMHINGVYDDGVSASGVLAPTYTLTAGTLPVGLALNATTGAITGTPTIGGAYSFTITATNIDGSASVLLSGNVFVPPAFTDSVLGRIGTTTAFVDGVTATGVETPTYSVGGGLPAGLTLNTTTGTVTGTATTGGAYSFTITATNSEGTAAVTFNGFVFSPPVFTDSTLDRIDTVNPHTDGVIASGVEAPIYTVSAGTLPAGLALNATTGAVTGTALATASGPYSFTITATNSEGVASVALSGSVFTTPFVFTDSTIGHLRLGTAFIDGVLANGVAAPTYTTTAGALPAGLALNATTGAITGTPTTGGAYTFEITATNSEGFIATTLTGTVFASPVFTDSSVGRMDRAVAYNDGIAASGVAAPTYAVIDGTLPAGLALNATTGAITGTPTAGGAYSVTIAATNSEATVSISLSGTVFSLPVSFSDGTIGTLKVGDAFVDGVLADGTPAPTYSVTAGELPGGLTLDATTGAITGTPTEASEGAYSFTLTATNSEGSMGKAFAGTVIAHDLGFLGLGPIRLLDTRLTGKRPAGSVVDVLVGGVAGVPADATSVVLNVTVQDPNGTGYLTVFPCGSPIPNASNANFLAGQTIPNSVTAAVGEGGKVCMYTTTATNIIVDLNGAYSPTAGAGKLLGLTPARLLDTRGPGGKLAGGVVRAVQVAGAGGVPVDASSVVLNVTADAPEALGYVTAFPCSSVRPDASNLNFLSGQTVANAVTVAVGASGTVCFYSTATTHLIVDVEAAYSLASGVGELFWMEPTRMFDSRGANAKVVAGSVVELVVAGAFGVPASTIAIALNVTVDAPNTGGFVTVFPCGAPVPYASNLNFTPGQTVANSVLATVGAGGKVCFYVTATTHLIIDVNAAYVAS